jgi:ATP-binding cassette subfamily B protein
MTEYTKQLEQGTLTQKAFDKKKAELIATATVTDRKILDGISFDLKPGHTLGIMGATGSGKTSIVNLLSRFCDTTSGTVKLDGVDTKQLTLAQLRSSVAQVMQDVFLFSDSISENVRMGKRNMVNDTEILDSLQKSLAMEFVEKMDEGTETIIGERGVGLSGGQKQRISIARALAKKAPVLVLDDSTSALDMETELEFQKVLGTLSGVSKIIVAHRISAVRHADEIIFIEDGRIAERGNHETLLDKKGLYYDTYMAQYGAFLEEGQGK